MPKVPDIASIPHERGQLIADLIAGLTFAVINVPQAMGNALLATVNPALGLHTLMIATPIGALFTSSVFMNISTTGALSVAVGDSLTYYPVAQRTTALITLVLLIGLFQLAFGIFKLGSLMRFVSHSVMTGFITGLGALIILGQVNDLTGFSTNLSSKPLRLAELLLNLDQVDPFTTVVGVTTIGLIVAFTVTRLSKFAMILALVIVTVLVTLVTAATDVDPIPLVGDIAEISRSLPSPELPKLSLVVGLVVPAISIGIIGLVQGAGVSQSYPNPDGKYPDISRDFLGTGLANIATGFFQGIPGGGSMSGTAVTVGAGARTRWTNVFSGLFVAIIVLLFASVVKLLPLAALSGLLVVVGFQTIKPHEIATVWQTNTVARTAMVLTFASTLVMPLQFAILVGVAISILLYVFRSSNEVRVVQFVPVEGGLPVEQPAPAELPSHQVTMLYPYGSLFFAATATFEQELPEAGQAQQAVVILILRGHQEEGSTFIMVLSRYTKTLQANGGKLMLAGVSPTLRDQLRRTGAMDFIGEENVFMVEDQLGASMSAAYLSAKAWLEQDNPDLADR